MAWGLWLKIRERGAEPQVETSVVPQRLPQERALFSSRFHWSLDWFLEFDDAKAFEFFRTDFKRFVRYCQSYGRSFVSLLRACRRLKHSFGERTLVALGVGDGDVDGQDAEDMCAFLFDVLKRKHDKERPKKLNVLKKMDTEKIGLKVEGKSEKKDKRAVRRDGKRKREDGEEDEEDGEGKVNKVVMLFDGTTNSLFEDQAKSNVGLLFEELVKGHEVMEIEEKVKYSRRDPDTLVVYYAGPCTDSYSWGVFGWADFAVGLSSLTICDDAIRGFKLISKGCAPNTDAFVFGFSRAPPSPACLSNSFTARKKPPFQTTTLPFMLVCSTLCLRWANPDSTPSTLTSRLRHTWCTSVPLTR